MIWMIICLSVYDRGGRTRGSNFSRLSSDLQLASWPECNLETNSGTSHFSLEEKYLRNVLQFKINETIFNLKRSDLIYSWPLE